MHGEKYLTFMYFQFHVANHFIANFTKLFKETNLIKLF